MSIRGNVKFDEYASHDALFHLDNNGEMCGQAFTNGNGARNISDAIFYLESVRIAGSDPFNANIYAEIFAATGVVGTDAVPTGNALGSSPHNGFSWIDENDAKDFSFPFDTQWSNPCMLQQNTDYVIVLYIEGMTGTGEIDVCMGVDETSPTHAGNFCYNTGSGWVADDAKDAYFKLYAPPPIGELTSLGNNTLSIS